MLLRVVAKLVDSPRTYPYNIKKGAGGGNSANFATTVLSQRCTNMKITLLQDICPYVFVELLLLLRWDEAARIGFDACVSNHEFIVELSIFTCLVAKLDGFTQFDFSEPIYLGCPPICDETE